MAKVFPVKTALYSKPIRIIIDDIAIEEIMDYTVTLQTYELSTAYEYQVAGKPNASVIIQGKNFKLSCQPEAMKVVETNDYTLVYLYGILPKVFPGLFKDKLLESWQKAYLKTQTSDLYERAKIWRDNPMFDSINAQWFKKGWDADYE